MTKLGDYLEEINTALATRGEGIYFESMDDVKESLEHQREQYDDRVAKYTTLAATFSGGGIGGKLMPEIHADTAEAIEAVSANDLATLGLVGGLTFSTIPAYKAKKHKDKRDEIDQAIQDIEEGNYDQDATDFAYEIVDHL